MRVGELSNTNVQVLPHVNVQVSLWVRGQCRPVGAGAGNDVCVFALYIKNTSSYLMHSSVTFGVAGLGLGVQVQVRVQATMFLATSVPVGGLQGVPGGVLEEACRNHL